MISESEKNRLGEEPLKSLSQILEEDDYLTLLFSFERETHEQPLGLDTQSIWVLKKEIRTPLPVIEPKSLAVFLREKRKHDFLRPRASAFLTTLAQIDYCIRNPNPPRVPANLEKLISDFVDQRSLSLSKKETNVGVMSPICLNQTKRSSMKSTLSRRRESRISKPDIIESGTVDDTPTPKLTREMTFAQTEIAIWPCSDIQTSRIFGPVRFPSREIYMGEFKHGMKDGYGIQIWPDGSLYEGYWRAGERELLGLMVFSDGDVYEGEWAGGKMNGLGVFRSLNTFEYRGGFLGNEPEGKGEEEWGCKIIIRGNWIRGKRNGFFEILGKDWQLIGQILENESIQALTLTRRKLVWTLHLVAGFFEGTFECRKESHQGSFTLSGTLIKGKANGKATATCEGQVYHLTFSHGLLTQAATKPKAPSLPIKDGKLTSSSLPDGHPLFLFEAIAGLEGVCVPFL